MHLLKIAKSSSTLRIKELDQVINLAFEDLLSSITSDIL